MNSYRRVLIIFLSFILPCLSEVLISYNASAGDDPSVLGLINLQGWDDKDQMLYWPSGQGSNSSAFFNSSTDPSSIPAAHVHRDAHFRRAEYHVLKGETKVNTTYYIGYHVMWEKVDYETIVFQWKNYDANTVDTDNIPVVLVFGRDANDSANHTIYFRAEADPSNNSASNLLWSKSITMGEDHRFGIVVDTSRTEGFVQLYFDGKETTFVNPTTKEKETKHQGNYLPGTGNSSPKLGLYGGDNYLECDSYVYGFVVGTTIQDISEIAGIAA